MPSVCCPGCQQTIEVTDEEVASGLIVECTGCESRFRLQAAAPSSVVRRAPVSSRVEADAAEPAADDRAPVEQGLFCHECGSKLPRGADVCPRCEEARAGGLAAPPAADVGRNRIVAGILGILLGGFGVHKFFLGMNEAGMWMFFGTLLTCGMGGLLTFPIGLVEGIIYLAKSDEDFYRTYVVSKKQWF